MLKVYFQCGFIILPTLISLFYPIQKLFYGLLALLTVDVDKVEIALNSLLIGERYISIVSGIILSVFIYMWRRRSNKEKTFNTGNRYGDFQFWIYFVASKVLGYGTVSIIRVPIYLQFKLIIRDIFTNVYADEDIENKESKAIVTKKNMERASNEINFLLADTYEITENQIQFSKKQLPTIIIENGMEFSGHRTFNTEFVKAIRQQVNQYGVLYERVNIFATTNTNHNKVIVNTCFKNAARTGFKSIYVFQARNGDFNFSQSYKVL